MKKNKINTILKDLVQLVKDDKDELKDKDFYLYDRSKFISRYGKDELNKKYSYDIDLETLKTMIFQIHLYGSIIHTDDENEDLTDLEKRVYSGETIIGDKKKMYWTENGWEEAENEYGKTEKFD